MTTNKKDNELAKSQQHSALYQEVPDFLRGETGNQAGMEEVDSSDILMPRLGLCQALSPQRRMSDPSFIPELKEGELFNTVTNEIFGKELDIICLYFFKNRVKFFDLDDGGGIECSSPNAIDGGKITPEGCASCRFSVWGNGAIDKDSPEAQEAPACTLYHNFMGFLPSVDMPSPIAVSYKSTGIKFSKQLLANVRVTNLPMYAKVYKVSVVLMHKDKNEWFEKRITPGAYIDQGLFKQMDELFKNLKDMNIKVDTTGEAAETAFDGQTLDGEQQGAF